MSNTILIINPMPGGSGYTSTQKAHNYVRRGRAAWNDDGTLRLTSRPQGPARHLDCGIMCYWNGCDTSKFAMHKPGENVAFPKARQWGRNL